jgi:hypothetical protein
MWAASLFLRYARQKFKHRSKVVNPAGTAPTDLCWQGMSRRAEDCRKKAMECHHRAFACQDPTHRVIYLDLVYQWRQIAEEFEAIDKERRKLVRERS